MRVWGLLSPLFSLSAFATEGAPTCYRAMLPIKSSVKLGKAARILTPAIAGAWQLGTAGATYLATESLGASGLLLLQGGRRFDAAHGGRSPAG